MSSIINIEYENNYKLKCTPNVKDSDNNIISDLNDQCNKCNILDNLEDISNMVNSKNNSDYINNNNLNLKSKPSLSDDPIKKAKILCNCDNYIGIFNNDNNTNINQNLYDKLIEGSNTNEPWSIVDNYLDNIPCGAPDKLAELKMHTRILLCKLFSCANSNIRDNGNDNSLTCKNNTKTATNNVTIIFRIIGYIILCIITYRSYNQIFNIIKSNFDFFIITLLTLSIVIILPFIINISNSIKNKKVKNNWVPYSEISLILFLLQKLYDEYVYNNGWILPLLPLFGYFLNINTNVIEKARHSNLFFSI
jgi:hypothetical protein